MKTKIVRNIEIETVDLPKSSFWDYREAELEGSGFVQQEGEAITDMPVTVQETCYVPCELYNPETKEREWYHVKLDDQKLWRDLVKVSEHFVDKKIRDAKDETWRKSAIKLDREISAIKNLPWWKRLFNQF